MLPIFSGNSRNNSNGSSSNQFTDYRKVGWTKAPLNIHETACICAKASFFVVASANEFGVPGSSRGHRVGFIQDILCPKCMAVQVD